MSYTLIYWITRLDALQRFGVVVTIFGIIGVVICKALQDDYSDEALRIHIKHMKICVMAVVLGCAIWLFVPTTKEAAAIYLIPKIVNSEEVKKVPKNTMKLLNTKMEQWIEDSLSDDDKEE